MANYTGTASIPNSVPLDMGSANVDLSGTPSLQVALFTNATGAPADTHRYVSDVTAAATECADTDYARQTVGSPSFSQVGDLARLTSSAVTFTASTADITARWYVMFLNTGNDATSIVLQWGLLNDADANVTVSPPDNIVITPDPTNGWLDLDVAA